MNGELKVLEISFQVKVKEQQFVVGCGVTAHIDECGQNTAKKLVLSLPGGPAPGHLATLKAKLQKALSDIEALERNQR